MNTTFGFSAAQGSTPTKPSNNPVNKRILHHDKTIPPCNPSVTWRDRPGRKPPSDLLLPPPQPNHHRRSARPQGIINQIPSRVHITANIRVRQHQGRHKFNNLIQSPKSHPSRRTQHHDTHPRLQPNPEPGLHSGPLRLPTQPRRNPEPIGVHHLVILQPLRDQPQRVEHRIRPVIRPRFR